MDEPRSPADPLSLNPYGDAKSSEKNIANTINSVKLSNSAISARLISKETTCGRNKNNLEAIDETDSFCTDSSFLINNNSVSTHYRNSFKGIS